MRNPSRALQDSIFEPLYSQEVEIHPQLTMPSTQSPSSSSDNWLSLNPIFSIPAPPATVMKRAASTTFSENIPGEDLSSGVKPTEFGCSIPPVRFCSSSDVANRDDGSVASKLLSFITKSISSPSLLACCKESARETSYQKSLRLRTMKLQHCAEELGSESSEGLLHGGDYCNIMMLDSLSKMSSSQSTRDFSAEYQKGEGNSDISSKLISVRSSPNLGCSSLVSKPPCHTKERSFPPPLSHTLPRSASLDSPSYSLCAFRKNGRFVLKECKVPSRQFLQASRKDGRLTLQCLTSTDEELEGMPTTDAAHIEQRRDLQYSEHDVAGVYADGVSGHVGTSDEVKDESTDKVEVESTKNTADLVEGSGACKVKGSSRSVNVAEERRNAKEVGCLHAEFCPMPGLALSNGSTSSSVEVNDTANFMSLGVSISSKMKSDFKTAKCTTTSKASYTRTLPNQHLLLSSLNRQSLLHFPGQMPNLKLDCDFDATELTQGAGISGLQSKSSSGILSGGGKTLQGFELAPTSSETSGYDIGKHPSSTIIFKDVSAKSLMEDVRKLVASFGLQYGRKWSCEDERGLDKSPDEDNGGIMESCVYKGFKSINIGVKEIESGCSQELIRRGVMVDVESCQRSLYSGAFREDEWDVDDGFARSCLLSSSLHFSVKIPPSCRARKPPLPFQSVGWLHTLHCK